MKFFAIFVAFASVSTSTCLALMVNTPMNVAQCLPVLIQMSGGTPPYYLSLIPAGQPSAAAFKTFPATNDEEVTWKCDLASGTNMNLALRDSTGTIAYSDTVTVGSGSDSSCVNASTDGTFISTNTANSTSSDIGSTASSTASGSASVSSTSSGAAHSLSFEAVGITGLLGVISVALL